MSTYELPDGFQSMETAPKNTWVNVIDASGNYGRDIYLEGRYIYRFAPMWIGWSPVVPPKKKPRFVVVKSSEGWCHNAPFMIRDNVSTHIVSNRIPTESAAQRIADIYEQAYEVTP